MCVPVSISTRIPLFNSWRMHEQDKTIGNSTWSEKKFELRGLKQQSLLQACFPLIVQHHLSPTVSFISHRLYYIPSMWENLHIWTKTLPIHGAICSPGCKTVDTSTNILHLPSLRRRLLVIRHVWAGKLGHSNWSYEPVEGFPEFWSQRALQAFPPSELLQAWLGRMLFPRSPSKLICCTSWGDKILMHFTQLTNSLHYRR